MVRARLLEDIDGEILTNRTLEVLEFVHFEVHTSVLKGNIISETSLLLKDLNHEHPPEVLIDIEAPIKTLLLLNLIELLEESVETTSFLAIVNLTIGTF